MIKDILKMGGCKTEAEFYKKYPTEQSFLEAFPQARPILETYNSGGSASYQPHSPSPEFIYNTTPMMFDYGGGMGDPFDPSIPKVQSYAQGGSVSKKTLKAIMDAAKSQMIDPQYLAEALKSVPNALETLESMSASERKTALSQMARELKAKMVQQQAMQQNQGMQAPDQSMAGNEQAEQMEQSPDMETAADQSSETAMAQYGMSFVNDKLYKFIRGGDIEGYPAAAQLPDADIYRTFPPNIPRLFRDGGLTMFQGTNGSSQFGNPGTDGAYINAIQQAQQAAAQTAARETIAQSAMASGVPAAIAYGGKDMGLDLEIFAKDLGIVAATYLTHKFSKPVAKKSYEAAKKAVEAAGKKWAELGLKEKMWEVTKDLAKKGIKSSWGAAALVGAGLLGKDAYNYFSGSDATVTTGAGQPAAKDSTTTGVMEQQGLIAPLTNIDVPEADTSIFSTMPTKVTSNKGKSSKGIPMDTISTYTVKKSGGNQGPMNYGAFPAIMAAGGASPSDLKPDNVIDTNKQIFKDYLSDNMKMDRLKKFLENNQEEQMMGMMNPQKKKGGPNLMTFQGEKNASETALKNYKGYGLTPKAIKMLDANRTYLSQAKEPSMMDYIKDKAMIFQDALAHPASATYAILSGFDRSKFYDPALRAVDNNLFGLENPFWYAQQLDTGNYEDALSNLIIHGIFKGVPALRDVKNVRQIPHALPHGAFFADGGENDGLLMYQSATTPGQVNMGYKGMYSTVEPEEDQQASGTTSLQMPNLFDINKYQQTPQGWHPSMQLPQEDNTDPMADYNEDITRMPGSFQSDRMYPDKGATSNAAPDNTKQNKPGLSQNQKRQARVLAGLAIGNHLVSGYQNKLDREREAEIDKQRDYLKFAVAKPVDRGMYMTNMDVPVPPTKQTPVQFSGYNPFGYASAKEGREVNNSHIAYMTDEEIKRIISLGGQVEFLD